MSLVLAAIYTQALWVSPTGYRWLLVAVPMVTGDTRAWFVAKYSQGLEGRAGVFRLLFQLYHGIIYEVA